MNRPRSFEEVQTMLTQLESRVAKFETLNIDLHQRRIINAAPAVSNGDYTTLEQVNSFISNIPSSTNIINNTTSSSPIGASVALTAQTTTIIATNIPVNGAIAVAGLYIVNIYAKCIVAGSGGAALTVNILFNDGTSVKTWPWSCQLLSTSAVLSTIAAPQVILTDGSAHIQYSTSVVATGSPQYDLYLEVIKIN